MGSTRRSWCVSALSTMLLASCSHSGIQPNPVTSTTTTSTIATNTKGRPAVSYDPCTAFPANLLQSLDLTRKPPEPASQSDGDIENKMCYFYSTHKHNVTVAASNYTLEMDRKIAGHWGFQDTEVGGRKALSYYLSKQPDASTCAIDVSASAGIFGVMVGSAAKDYAPYPDCLGAARAYAEAFLPHFPF